MTVPSAIRKLLGDREVKAHAALSCSLHGPIGETHFVVANGQLFVYERESLIGDFSQVDLDPTQPPKLQKGAFNDILHVALRDGAAHTVQVSSFDQEPLTRLLQEHAAPVPAVEPPEPEPAEKHERGFEPEPQQSRPEPPTVAPYRPPVSKHGIIPPERVDPDEAQEAEEAAKEAAKRKNSNIYHGSDPGCGGCLIQILVFFAGILAMWFAHEHAMLNAGVVEPTDDYDNSAVFVITKIVAVIAGMYLGGKTASLLGHLMQRLNWTGRVAFSGGRVQFIGQRGKWQVNIDPSRPFELQGGAHTATAPGTDKQGRPEKRGFSVFVRVSQDGQVCALKTGVSRGESPDEISGVALAPLGEAWQDERLITMDGKTLRQVLRRLRDWQ